MRILNRHAGSFMAALSAALSLALLLPLLAACHQVPYCVGSCGQDTQEGDAAESPELPDGMEGDAVTDVPPPDAEGTDGTEAADNAEIELQDIPPDGCIPCEFTYPSCVEGHMCCTGDGKETCNHIDDDCDGQVDEDIDFDTNARHCGECNHSCTLPHAETACQGGGCVFLGCLSYFADCVTDNPSVPETLGCETYCVQTAEEDTVCDMIDNDCDCQVDENIDLTTDPDNCGACGTRCRFPHATGECFSPDGTPESALCRIASCDSGYYDVDPDAPGCEYSCAACEYTVGGCLLGHTCCTSSGLETCNGLDDECNGEIDEGNPEGGGSCGNTVGECRPGTLTCIDGSLECQGGVLPAQEACDGRDDDCDGATDEPDAGDTYLHDENQPCGDTSLGDCELGTTLCVTGVLECQGYIGPAAEACDGHDNDCDGTVDQPPIPGEGAACGSSVGTCRQGTTMCQAGAWDCQGETGPSVEVCDGLDNDCSGVVDDPFNLNVDPNNCGSCGTRCSTIVGPHTIYICNSGICTVIGCEEGYWDNDLDPLTCEYACTYTGSEICDGLDNDCNGLTDTADTGMAIPPNFCSQIGACVGSSPACTRHGTTTKWYCTYGPDVNLDADFETLLPENDCDEVDNDCDGAVDEAFPLKGTSCSAGDGLCRRTGTYICKTSQDGIECTAVAGAPQPETCNGTDDDCDTIVDNFGETAWSIIGAQAAAGSGALYVFRYEASRPNAGACAMGSQEGSGAGLTTKPCSRTSVQPWTSLDWTTALEACCNLNDDIGGGVCHYGGGGAPQRWNLCTAPVWEEVCESQGQNYAYPYGNTYQPNSCNGNDFDTNCPCPTCTDTTGDQDEILAVGSMGTCCSNWGGCIYDMSGNVKEWTYTQRGIGYREIRGGSSNTPYGGLTCQFSFAIGAEDFLFYNLGFRCCYF